MEEKKYTSSDLTNSSNSSARKKLQTEDTSFEPKLVKKATSIRDKIVNIYAKSVSIS